VACASIQLIKTPRTDESITDPEYLGATHSPTTPAADSARITVLYDAFGNDAAMTKDWGYAALVEINGKRILFDTGDDPAIFAKNVKAKGVDLTKSEGQDLRTQGWPWWHFWLRCTQ